MNYQRARGRKKEKNLRLRTDTGGQLWGWAGPQKDGGAWLLVVQGEGLTIYNLVLESYLGTQLFPSPVLGTFSFCCSLIVLLPKVNSELVTRILSSKVEIQSPQGIIAPSRWPSY